jgi:uncharacterized damage-inducible protein DinB
MLLDTLLQSWDRQAKIIANLASLVTEANRSAKPSADGWTLSEHLGHIHEVRRHWLAKASAKHAAELPHIETHNPNLNLVDVRTALDASAAAVRAALEEAVQSEVVQFGPYDSPIYFLQHMVWHEGYHAGLILLALRNAGQEPTEEWDEYNIWALWRVDEWD